MAKGIHLVTDRAKRTLCGMPLTHRVSWVRVGSVSPGEVICSACLVYQKAKASG